MTCRPEHLQYHHAQHDLYRHHIISVDIVITIIIISIADVTTVVTTITIRRHRHRHLRVCYIIVYYITL